MTDRYVGLGGNDGNSGLDWANRKLTLNGVEDTPVVAGDTIYVAPGVYRELFTVDVDGAGGNIITYIGDVTGENTDSVGGVVRITGSDNDQSAIRDYGIRVDTKDYRTFRGFYLDIVAVEMISLLHAENIIIEDCVFGPRNATDANGSLAITGTGQGQATIRRCLFLPSNHAHIFIFAGSDLDDLGHLIENCIFIGAQAGVIVQNVGGIIIKNCGFLGIDSGVRLEAAPDAGQTITVNNSYFVACKTAMVGIDSVAFLLENYNSFFGNDVDRTTVSVGGNSNNYPPIVNPPILKDGFQMPWNPFALSEWSQIGAIAGTGMPTDDLYGITRPVTDSKKSWGAIQFRDNERETTTTYDGSDASIKFADAGRYQMFMPVANESTTISVRVYREADYTGTNPQLIIKQPGQADDVTVDVAAASQWNELTTTLTPAAIPPYVIIELVSNNTAVAGDYDVFFDSIVVS